MTPRRLKFGAIVLGIALSALTLLAWTQEWFGIHLGSGQSLSVAGDVAAPALTALALSGLALVGALAIAGPFFRVVLGVLEVAIGALVVTSAALALGSPITASGAAITAATGVSGPESLAAAVSAVAVSAWPVVTCALGVVLALLGVGIVITSKNWPASGRKYQAVRLEKADGTPIGDWDALSDGRDPT